MKNGVAIIIAALLGLLIGIYLTDNGTVTAAAQETAYDRVMRTSVLRCGYAVWPPTAIVKDPTTGKMTGMFVEIAEQMAKNLHLKIEWVEETGWSSFMEGLETRRFDVFCAPIWRNAERGKRLEFTVPLAYSALHFYTRAGDTRFDNGLEKLNDPAIKLATMDGEISQVIAHNVFPKAQELSIPQLGDVTQMLLNVATGKADGVFQESSLARDFANKNPGKIHRATKEPFQIFPNMYGMLIGEVKLKSMLDSALSEMLDQGLVDSIIARHEPDRSLFLPVAKPYEYAPPPALP